VVRQPVGTRTHPMTLCERMRSAASRARVAGNVNPCHKAVTITPGQPHACFLFVGAQALSKAFLYLSWAELGEQVVVFSLVLRSAITMTSRESNQNDGNSKVKHSVIMAPGEIEVKEWLDSTSEWAWRSSCGFVDFEIDQYVLVDSSKEVTLLIKIIVSRPENEPQYFDFFSSVYGDGSSAFDSWRKFKDSTLSYPYPDAWCIDEVVQDMMGHWQSDVLSNIADDHNKEYWADYDTQTPSSPALFCGICVLGNLHASPTEHLLGRNSLNRVQKHKRNRRKALGDCRSTITLISKNSESLKGTGLWFLNYERYHQWLDQPSSFLWLCGSPGSGKSVLMSTVIRDLEKTRRAGELVVYYYANGYYHGVSTARAILCSILGQLLLREPIQSSFREILPLLNDFIAIGNPLSSTSMIWLFSKIRHRLRGHETLYLLLDGLDEETHSSHERELVLELIDHASRHDPNHQIKCFVSSRSTFFGNRLPKGALQVDLDSNSLTRRDMSLYVQDSLHKSQFEYPSRDVQELEELLLNSASGSFLILRLILEQGRPGPGNSTTNFKDFLVNLSDFSEITLGTIYAGMLARIEDCHKEAALSMLRWVTFAARPLKSEELLILYKQSGYELKEEDISNISAGLLISSGNQIRFTHLSVREYFESQLSDRWEELSEEANEMIAHACLKVLSTENILKSLNLSFSSVPSSKTSITSGFVPYAQAHWICHYKRAERRSTYLAGLLHHILEKGLKMSKENEELAEETPNEIDRGDVDNLSRVKRRAGNLQSLDVVNIALGVGARFGFTKLSNLELDMGANLNIASGPDQQTPLCLAAKSGHLEVARLLLQRGADPCIASGSGLTPMAYAMASGHYDIQDLLMNFAATQSRRSAIQEELGGAQEVTQDFWLTAIISVACNSCTESWINYEVSEQRQ
jgi:Cdc6-like AAA superfamily ATPase